MGVIPPQRARGFTLVSEGLVHVRFGPAVPRWCKITALYFYMFLVQSFQQKKNKVYNIVNFLTCIITARLLYTLVTKKHKPAQYTADPKFR